ncbi:MAG: polyphenol oxidase family protein [Dictyoglomus sp.]|nr:polyphenol oxidase family protein [Dictyoglomus sp.]MCX7942351.1 polyphenol oxidase family protein [Dictyoglomaceae bacterium]MDW8188445.1 polyphenol oxidase family protein [Dictyoglomus sp.]
MLRFGYWKSQLLDSFSEISHGFASEPFSFNLYFDVRNIKAFIYLYKLTKIPFKNWIIAKQIHSDNINYIKRDNNLFFPKLVKNTDALLVSEKNKMIIMFFADCFPIYIYIPKIPLVGLIHVGWRGAIKRFPFKVLKELFENYKLSPNEIYLAIGPGIQKCCFQVGRNFINYLDEQSMKYLEKINDSLYFNLLGFILSQIFKYNLPSENLDISNICTKCSLNFYSFRRDKTNKRNVGFIYIK